MDSRHHVTATSGRRFHLSGVTEAWTGLDSPDAKRHGVGYGVNLLTNIRHRIGCLDHGQCSCGQSRCQPLEVVQTAGHRQYKPTCHPWVLCNAIGLIIAITFTLGLPPCDRNSEVTVSAELVSYIIVSGE